MTMLDRMRRHKNWLKWSLALVCLAFVAFYVPDFLQGTDAPAASRDVVAEVEGREITAGQFRRVYQAQLQSYRGAYGNNINESLLKQLGIDQQILQQMVDEQAALAEADRLGLDATDAEVRERLMSIPAFQENGQFFGEQRYRQLLSMQRPPLTTAEFEENLRRGIVADKLRDALTEWITVTDQDIDKEFKRRNEKVKIDVVAFAADKFRSAVSASDAEVKAHFEANKTTYKTPEKRKIRFLAIDTQALRAKVNVPAQDVENSYKSNIAQYSTPEQVRASHILLKTEGTDEAAVKRQADDLLAKAKAGADFAALATKFSQDEDSAKKGGDLDYFGKGRMVPAFEQAAFALKPGELSDLVKTQYGFHIIKAVDHKAPTVRALDEVRPQIVEQLKWERAQAQATDLAQALDAEIDKPADLDRAAASRGLKVQESAFFARDEPIAGVGLSPEVATAAFEAKEGDVSSATRTPQGYVLVTVTGKQAPAIPKFEEVRDKAREDLVKQKAIELAKQKAAEVAPTLRAAADFAAAAKAAGVDVKTSELVARGTALPEVGMSAAVDAAAFSLPKGGVSDPILSEKGVTIVRVAERQEPSATELASSRETLRGELANERRSRFFTSYLAKAKERMKIQIHRDVLQKIVA